ncbi:helix-turn-helix domain-containing protein [Haloarcula nitratireducens]|uniref:Helix-turn-helix domain-containing protein n=1 Tax=Haloarcula nitratireducens TaxID=2487749 RepID=A0AAW4PG47_9EURY|nr:helix-turn-helix domain-containing protein [Halomicroarcula nitratireducens]MBX0296866.1 helix-turn-helix domain-containing protein [Halomicroarcula nitratireducens]
MATNPLTDEQVVIRETINNLVDSARLDVLRALAEQAQTPSAINAQGVVTRQTASDHLARFTERGLTKPVAEQCGYELTAGGKITLEAIETCLDVLDTDQLACLTRSTHALNVLNSLAAGSARPHELARAGADAPSRSTVQRMLNMCEAQGWSSTTGGTHRLTPAGQTVLDAYNDLALSIEQVVEKAPWLQRLDQCRSDLPVQALADAKVVTSCPDSPGIVFGAALDLCDPQLDQFRALTSIYNPPLFRAYNRLLKWGLPGEAIVDNFVYEKLHAQGLEHFLDDSEFADFDIGWLEEQLTLGIGLYDDRKVTIGAYNETGDATHIAMLVSTNQTVVDWGIDLYNTYWERAHRKAEQAPKVVSG